MFYGSARRRLRLWRVLCWFYWCAFRFVFPSIVVRPKMRCIMAGMLQKDRYVAMLFVEFFQWHVQGWYCWFFSPRDVFLFVVFRPQMLGIMSSMIQKDVSVVKVINIPVVAQRLSHMVLAVQQTIEILQLLLGKVFAKASQRQFSMIRLFSKS